MSRRARLKSSASHRAVLPLFITARNSVVCRFDVTDAQANALITALRRPAKAAQ